MNPAQVEQLTEFHRQAVETHAARAANDPVQHAWAVARRAAWTILLGLSLLGYYLLCKLHEAICIL